MDILAVNLGQVMFAVPLAVALVQLIKLFAPEGFVRIGHVQLARICFVSVVACYLLLTYKFVVSDFSYRVVFENSHTLKPLLYKITGVWGNHEGSMLLFIMILSGYGFVYANHSKFELKAQVLGYQGAVLFFILFYTYFTSNPFDGLAMKADDGMGLNPLLQDIGLAIHPPILYLGYAGFSLAFSMALVVLRNRITDKNWVNAVRPWILFAWSVLSVGVALGSWWAYRELGWGGFWFWDPVENISLLPWLFGTALIHSVLCTKKFNRFALMTLMLCLLTFLSALLGFFLVRSGLLSSVHTFASDPSRGMVMLGIIFIMASYAMIMFGNRMFELKIFAEGKMHFLSREIFILIGIILLMAMTISILLGVFYPLILEMFFQKKISVGEPYFNNIFVPVALVLMVFMIFAPTLKWQRERALPLVKKASPSFIFSALVAVLMFRGYAQISGFIAVAVFISLWLVTSAVEVVTRRLLKGEKVSKGYASMIIAHTAFGLIGLSIALMIGFESDNQVVFHAGEEKRVAGYDVKLKTTQVVKGTNYLAQKSDFNVNDKGVLLTTLSPENRIYFPGMVRTHETDIHTGLFRDIYFVLGQGEQAAGADNEMTDVFPVKIYIRPFISFLWGAVLLMAFGGILAMLPKKK